MTHRLLRRRVGSRALPVFVRAIVTASVACFATHAMADDTSYLVPQLLGAQYTFIEQWQNSLHAPYSGGLSLKPGGDQARSHTFGIYFGVPLANHLAFYLDTEMFRGQGVSNATGLAGLTNGDVIRGGGGTLSRSAYIARAFLTYDIPLGGKTTPQARKTDQLPGDLADDRLSFKLGLIAVNDDFDQSRYANSTRTQFMNWSLFNSPAWDFAADTRGYTVGGVATFATGPWTWRYGIYQMPTEANGDKLEGPIHRANGQNAQVTWQRDPDGASVWLMLYRNRARMGIYDDALRDARLAHTVPDIHADDREGRHKFGAAMGADLPLADHGDTGLFARAAWNDGKTESFVFTEADRSASVGAQLSGAHWHRADDRLGAAWAVNGLSPGHRAYLAAGGSGFTLGDGALNYGTEQIFEAYYNAAITSFAFVTADFQLIHNPGYNRDRGPARFLGLRVHLQY
ncbi:carbohydrate-selective porin (OprB family) [Luteibacter rhizovicinus]|uniref:Carbohydrate-selective porin (OprB family) n=1 Tax=Luteibacter rhizovicinus TaxID=242606 RepID=A0A4R3YQA2_9GAMM|nr:carbohydrate porin [Luteibacter rhizovicinus]TCV93384.1 carbohydrate-selective porin (OprB family) [Luteibacter rhizovicinus]